MAAIVESILKCTVGLLFNKGRDLIAEKLKDGDVMDQKFRNFISREFNDLISKIDGLARRDLVASLSFYREGISLLDRSFYSEEAGKVNQLLSHAKTHFEDARKKAVKAFSNEALKTSDRLLAMKIRISATIMEKIDCPATALELCKVCLEELHNMPVVQNYFSVEVTESLKSRFYKNERREVIADVCQMNYAVHRITLILKGDLLDQLPFITIDHLQIDPLRDPRLVRALKEFKVEHCILPAEWTFGSEGEPSAKLWRPFYITPNTQGQFIVADYENVKVFDPHGKFLFSLLSSNKLKLEASALDRNDNLYLCIGWARKTEIYVYLQTWDLHHRFPLKPRVSTAKSLTISKDQVFVVARYDNGVYQVDVYENDGRFVHSFGKDVLSQSDSSLHSITTSGDGVMILDAYTKYVHLFSAQGAHLRKFQLNECDKYCHGILFFEPSQHVLISSLEKDKKRGQLSIYTKNGEFVRSVQLDTERMTWLFGITVTVEGQVAVTNFLEDKVHVLQL